jgi:glycosyltransferase involved in cell wall biosynthesis
MKILHVIDHMGLGGAQLIIKGILEKSDKDSLCYVLRKSEVTTPIKKKLLVYRNTKHKFDFLSLLELRDFIKNKNIQIIHLHLQKSIFFGILLKLFFNKNIKVIVHEHGGIFKNNFFYNLFLKYTKNKVDMFIADSKVTKEKIMCYCAVPPDKIKVLYNFVDLSRFKKKKHKRKDNKFFVGLAGRIVKRKGWEIYIKAAKIISKKKANLRFVITGDGPDKQKLIKEIENEKSIDYLGYLNDINDFFNKIDCLVVPSYWEARSMVVMEAQAAQIPVIASNTEGLNEAIAHNKTGMLFEVGNAEKLADVILKLADDKNLKKKIIRNAYADVKNYSLENYFKKLKKIYSDLVGNVE